jgi:hypothetical protein
VAQLNVKLSGERLDALKRYAARRRMPVSWLIKDYFDYLLAGGRPAGPVPNGDSLTSRDLAELAERGGSLDWLHDEPDLYSEEDGEPSPAVRVRDIG